MAELEARLRDRYFASLRGRRLRVLVESPVAGRPGYVAGTSCRYTPIELAGGVELVGRFADVIAGDAINGQIQGRPLL